MLVKLKRCELIVNDEDFLALMSDGCKGFIYKTASKSIIVKFESYTQTLSSYMYSQINDNWGKLLRGFKLEFKNGNHFDYSRENLLYTRIYKSSTKTLGVSKTNNGNYASKVAYNNKVYHLGTFSSEVEAAIAYNKVLDLLGVKNVEKNVVDIPKHDYDRIYKTIRFGTKLKPDEEKVQSIYDNIPIEYKKGKGWKLYSIFGGKKITLGVYNSEYMAKIAYKEFNEYLHKREIGEDMQCTHFNISSLLNKLAKAKISL
ncbi:hypothetical protein D3C81_08090 [compost metagenome]